MKSAFQFLQIIHELRRWCGKLEGEFLGITTS